MSRVILPDDSISRTSPIMVVDDDDFVRDVVINILTPPEFTVVTASGAKECLYQLRAGFRGVILMDVTMPEVSGWDTIREIEQAGMLAGNVIVMLTAIYSPDEHMDGLQEVIIDYMTKPFTPSELIATVRKYSSYLERTRQIGV